MMLVSSISAKEYYELPTKTMMQSNEKVPVLTTNYYEPIQATNAPETNTITARDQVIYATVAESIPAVRNQNRSTDELFSSSAFKQSHNNLLFAIVAFILIF